SFFFHLTATTELSTLSLHDALPIYRNHGVWCGGVPVLCLVPGTLRRSGIRSSQPEDLPLIVSPASGASRHIVLHSSTSLRISSRSEEHTSELQSRSDLVCRLLLEKK